MDFPRNLALCTLVLLTAATVGHPGPEPVFFGFEDEGSPLNEKWLPSALDPATKSVSFSAEMARGGIQSLRVEGKLPEGFGVSYTPWRDWTGYTKLSFDLWIPSSVPAGEEAFDCWAYLKDSSYYWYQTPIYADATTLKRMRQPARGQWAHYELDISQTSAIWKPGGHKRSWRYATRHPREFGLRFFGKSPWEGSVFIDNVTLSGEDRVLGPMTQRAGTKRGWIEPVANSKSVPKYEKFELTFDVADTYENPFDPEIVDVQGHFISPSGNTVRVPGFYYQPYERSRTDEGHERLTPVGDACWKVRFAPKETGEYTYWVTVTDAEGVLASRPSTFSATAPLHPEGYVRVSRSDPRYFEFENGDWFWPIGINMRDGGDDASNQAGTYDFDRYFKRFHEEGLNFVRTWMCAWWGGIEWGDEYHSRFGDVGWYNLYNAWRLDYCVDLASQYDLFLEITFNSHGQVRRDKFDQEWLYSPWNVRNGGSVASPSMFFTDERVKRAFRNRYRYIVARWGYSRNVMSWDLWNEVDLVENYDPETVSGWHQEMAGYLKAIDPWKHIVVTHICLFWSYGNEMWRLPQIEFVQSDAYWDQKKDGRMDSGMFASYSGKVDPKQDNAPIFNKPFVFIEYGPQTTSVVAGQVNPQLWRHRFRVGMWTSAVLPTAASPMFWYHKEWDEYGLHQFQQPLRKLFADLDRRGRDFRMKPVLIVRGERLRGIGMSDDREGFFYIHDPERVGIEDRASITEKSEGAALMVFGVSPGEYSVEFLDSVSAEVVGRAQVVVEEDRRRLQCDLPPVADDLLVKLTKQ